MDNEIKVKVHESYSKMALNVLENNDSGCCGPTKEQTEIVSFGCDRELIKTVNIQKDEIVLDLGSGPGHDLLALAPDAKFAYGVDFSLDMIRLAKENQEKLGIENVEFLNNDIESIELPDESVDVIISNCVINLHPDKQAVFKEAYRLLKPGGRIVFSDMIADLSEEQKENLSSDVYCACIGGATSKEDYIHKLEVAGFREITATTEFNDTFESKIITADYESVLFVGYK